MTPPPDNALAELFEGREVRVIEHNNDIWFPLADICNAWGIDRSTPDKIIERNDDLFMSMTCTVSDTTSLPLPAVNEQGLYVLMGRITARKLKNPNAKAALLRFQKWVPELIKKYREQKMQVQTKIVPPMAVSKDPGEGWSAIAIGHLNFAKEIARQNPEMDPGMCLAVGIRQAERATGMDLSAYKKLIPPAPGQYQEEYLTATAIGREIGRTAQEVNRYLQKWGYVYRGEDDVLYMTNLGADYGKVFAGAFDSGHNGYFIKWKRSIIAAARMRQNSPHRIED